MRGFMKAFAVGLIVAIVALSVTCSYSVQNPKKPRIDQFEGRVSYCNWVTSIIKVRGVGNMEFYVPRGVRITKLAVPITLADINVLDNVIIRYYDDGYGKNIAVSINVTVV